MHNYIIVTNLTKAHHTCPIKTHESVFWVDKIVSFVLLVLADNNTRDANHRLIGPVPASLHPVDYVADTGLRQGVEG